MITAGGLRASFGVFIKPMEAELGWSRTSLSIAAALSLLVYGPVAPFAGQLVMIPLATWLTLTVGWRQSYVWLGLGLFVLILPLAVVFIRTDPRDKRLEPYGAAPARISEDAASSREKRISITEASSVPAFWLLVGSYFVCGWTSGGLVGTHLIPHAVEH